MKIQALYDHYIPVRKSEIVSAILRDPALPVKDRAGMNELIHWLALLYHVEFFAHSEQLKELYVQINPDRPGNGNIDAPPECHLEFLDELDKIMIAANFRPLDNDEVEDFAELEGRVRTNIKVPTEIFSEIRFYARGRRLRELTIPTWFGLRDKTIEVVTFDHVVFCMIPSPNAPPKKLRLGGLRAGAAYLHLFRDIPAADLKTLYPNAQAVLSLFRKLLLGVTTVITGAPLVLRIIPAVSVLMVVGGAYLGVTGSVQDDTFKKGVAAATVLAAVIGLGLRQWTSYDRHALRHQKELSEHANNNKMNKNAGCFDYLVAASEDAEVKEVILAYALMHFSDGPLGQQALDENVEAWFKARFDIDINFEIDDGIAKLQRLSMVREIDGKMVPVPIEKAIENCTDNWRLLSSNIARAGFDEDGSEY